MQEECREQERKTKVNHTQTDRRSVILFFLLREIHHCSLRYELNTVCIGSERDATECDREQGKKPSPSTRKDDQGMCCRE